jgi:hypothetical protein
MKKRLFIIVSFILILLFIYQENKVTKDYLHAVEPEKEFYEVQTNKHNLIKDNNLIFPATCFAPGTDPSILEQFYNERNALANSLGLSQEEITDRFNLQSRWGTTALDGSGLSQGDFTTLTWSYVPDGTPIGNGGCRVPGESTNPSNFIAFFNGIYGPPTIPGDFTTAPWHQLFVDMFDSWSAVSGLNFVYEPNDDGATVVTGGSGISGTRGDFRISGHPVDGNNNVLACNYFPENGDMIIDTSDNYFINNQTTGTTNVLTHEIGHGLGIFHVCPVEQTKLMEPFVSTAFIGPQEDDILAVNRFYGDVDGENDAPTNATVLGSDPNPFIYNVNQRSVDDDLDLDYYSFNISETTSADITLIPTGTTYLDGVQFSGGACSAGTNFNALTVSDLMFEILGPDGTSVLTTTDANGAGVAENSVTILAPGGPYYVRVMQQGAPVDNVQMYNLNVSLEEASCTTANVPANLQAGSITDSSVVLSWDAQSAVLYDLRYREVGTTVWTVEEDLISPSFEITSLNDITEYEVQVRAKCSVGPVSAYSSSIFFTTLETPLVYCDAGATDTQFEKISNVFFEGSNPGLSSINNTSTSTAGYEDFTAESAFVVRGAQYFNDFTVTISDPYPSDQILVWIDFNKDGDFEDAGENVFTSGTGQESFTGNINIPPSANLGSTRMRVRLHDASAGANATPCGNSQYGQVEDYTIIILEGGYTYSGGSWSPNNPVTGAVPSTNVDNISILDGTATLNGILLGNNLSVSSGATLVFNSTAIVNLDGDINNNGSVIFSSDETGSAQLDEFNGSLAGSGEVTVERYIPAGLPDLRRAFRLLTSSVTTTSSINANWQEGATTEDLDPNPNPGFGTHITGGDASLGFDQNGSGNPSMFTFDNTATGIQTNAWTPVPNTNTKTLKAGEAYLNLIRGDRSIDVTSNTSTPTNTTLRATGELFTGSRVFSSANNILFPEYGLNTEAGLFNLVGNPYQAIVDIYNLDLSNINPIFYWVWDPNLGLRGNYATVNLSDENNVTNNTSSPANQFIQPGQSFFVQTLADGASSLRFDEEDKSVSGTATSIFSEEDNPSIKMLLYTASAFNTGERETDGLLINFIENGNNGLDVYDADKFLGPDENLSRLQDDKLISIEQRALPTETEILTLSTTGYTEDNYTFVVKLSNVQDNFEAYLLDDYTGVQTQLSEGTTLVNFTVDNNIPESTASNRFRLVFEAVTFSTTENTFGLDFSMYPNPTKGQFSIKTSGLTGNSVELKIYNILGQEVFTETQNIEINGEVNVDASTLTSGMYIVKLEQDEQVFSAKLSIK